MLPAVFAGEVSRDAPPGYAEAAKLLTSLDDARRPHDPVAAQGKDGVVLLDEVIQTIDDSGRRLIIYHRIERALTEAGARRTAESVFDYGKSEGTIHLLLGRTIPPEGAPLPVRPEAALLHSPQAEAGNALYDDQEELRLIFPNVKPLSMTVVSQFEIRKVSPCLRARGMMRGCQPKSQPPPKGKNPPPDP